MNLQTEAVGTNPRLLLDMYAVAVELALPVFAAVLLVSLLALAALCVTMNGKVMAFAPFIVAFAFLGAVPGVIAGSSQQPIVGGLLTSLLGLVSALLAYLFGKETLQEWRPVIPFAIIVMAICALAGITVGGVYKAKMDDFEREYSEYRAELEQVSFPLEREARLLELRREHGAQSGP